MKAVRRIGLALSAILGILLIITLMLLLYLGSSNDGARRLFEIAQKMAPGELRAAAIDGRLAGPLLIKGLSYQQKDGLVLQNDSLSFNWHPLSLFRAQLEITELRLSGTALTLSQSESNEAPSGPYQGLNLPLAVSVENFSSDGFQLTTAPGESPITINHLDFKAATEAERLVISKLSFDGLSTKLELDGYVGLDESLPLSLNLAWHYSLPDGPLLNGQGKIEGDAQTVHLHQQLSAPLSSVIDVDLRNLLEAPSWQAELRLDEARLSEFVETFPAIVKGSLSAQGDLERAELKSDLQLTEPTLGEISSRLVAVYGDSKVNLTSIQITNPRALKIEGEGEYRLENNALTVKLQWQKFRWPLIGNQEAIRSEQGSLSLSGSLDDYEYQLAMGVRRSGLPAIEVSSIGNGDLKSLNLKQLVMAHQQSRIEGQGVVNWSPDVSWQVQLKGDKFNPGVIHQDFPGQLRFDVTSKGELTNGEPEADFQIKSLKGTLRDYPVDAVGRFEYHQDVATIEALTFHSGPNLIMAKGEVGALLALDWSVKAPDLAGFWPGLSGELNAKGKLSGKLATPAVKLNLDAKQIAYQAFRIERIDGAMDLNMSGGQPVSLLLDAAGLVAEERQWDALQIKIEGTLPEHKLNLELKGARQPQLNLFASGGLDKDQNWQGVLQQLEAGSIELGTWKLEKATEYYLGGSAQRLEPFCLRSEESRLCGRFANSSSEAWQAELQIENFTLARFQAWMPSGTGLQGVMGLRAELSGSPTAALQAAIDMRIPKAGLVFRYDELDHEVDFSGSHLTATLGQQGAIAELKMPLQDLGGLNGKFQLPSLTLPEIDLKQQPVKGEIEGSIDNLAMLSSLLPSLQNSRGKLLIDFALGGILTAPQLQGEAKLADGACDIPELGIELRDLALVIEAVELDKLKVTGSVRSGDGQLSLQGSTKLDADAGFPSEYKISGKDWLAIDVPEAEVQLSPELVFKYQAKGSELKGSVKVPYARLRPRELPKTAVSVSSDLVLKEAQDDEAVDSDSPLRTEIRLVLGKRVSFDGFGLRGNFNGSLLIIDEPGRPVLGRGRLGITDGVYQAYGQDLEIEQGYALFADSPVDNPGINVRAVRIVDEVTAGLRVSGTLKNPKLDLFSTPTMSEGDVLTYLLTGRPPGGSSGQTVGLAAALKASGASSAASELGRRFGLEELRVDTGSSLEEASLVAGTYLSPKLYVQYINELSTSETKLRMRYDLTDRWQVEAETGRTQAGDFFYTFER